MSHDVKDGFCIYCECHDYDTHNRSCTPEREALATKPYTDRIATLEAQLTQLQAERDEAVGLYALASIPERPGDPITADWLREEWGAEIDHYEGTGYDVVEYHCLSVGDLDACINVEFMGDGVRVYLHDACTDRVVCELPHVTTRHQFTQLMASLGSEQGTKGEE